ncbi:hypothetical protein [Microseira sp. BLCC-F43]|jgi:hypothetical protein|uniref:hypothetical protein n=1 Tax=Microseira sp. BLCC-F43 TaxID=3153602 RepID=UPI0035B7BD0B
MKNLIVSAIAFVKKLHVKRLVAVLIVIGTLFLANVNAVSANTFSGGQGTESSRFLEKMQKADEKSERPKTTGEWLEEAREDVPLNERVDNIARESAEAFKQFGKLYTTGAEETARAVKENAQEAAENVLK